MARKTNDIEPPWEPAAPVDADGDTRIESTPETQAGAAVPAGEGASVPGQVAAEAAEPEAFEFDRLRQEVESLRGKLAEHQDLALRARAELDNFRKRAARDVENAHKFALERFIGELLPVVDSIELSMDATRSVGDTAGLREGMDLTRRKFLDTLESFGVTTLDPQGEKFNPERHEAISIQSAEGTDAGTVITVMQKGYELNGRLLRPARVVVAK